MSKAIFRPEGLHLINLFKELESILDLFHRGDKGALLELRNFKDRFEDVITSVQPTHYEDRDGIQEKKRVPRKISKKADPMVRQYTVGYSRVSDSDRDRPNTEPSPTESERDNNYKDIG